MIALRNDLKPVGRKLNLENCPTIEFLNAWPILREANFYS